MGKQAIIKSPGDDNKSISRETSAISFSNLL